MNFGLNMFIILLCLPCFALCVHFTPLYSFFFIMERHKWTDDDILHEIITEILKLDFSDNPDRSEIDALQRHGSIRKVLHSLVGNDSLLGKSAKMLDRPKTKFEDETYTEYFREYSIIFEYNTLCDRLIPGLYVIPSANSCLTWYGVIFVRRGPYRGGVFRLTMEIPEDFPNSLPPRVMMDSGLYHPAVHPSTHELNVHDVFPRWSRTANRLWQVLEYTHSIFQQISIKCPWNKGAAELYENNRDEFEEKANECADKCAANAVSSVYHDISDAHFIRFSSFEDSVHSSALATLLTSTRNVSMKDQAAAATSQRGDSRPLGLSWVQAGSIKPCSRPERSLGLQSRPVKHTSPQSGS